jgi:CRISPR-associated protein Cmr4
MHTENGSILGMYAVTPCHAGCGASQGVVDLPIQRERHTQWPMIQASGMKGAMRAHFDSYKGKINTGADQVQFDNLTDLIFGSEKADHAGSLSVSDAKILAFPMRSNVAPFVWITCPAVLRRLNKDLRLLGRESIPSLADLDKLALQNAWCVSGSVSGPVLLEDMEVTARDGAAVATGLSPLLACFSAAERLLIVHDEVFTYGVTSCTQVMAQIKIDQSRGTTQDGSLRYQEELPADTLLYSVILWGPSREGKNVLTAETIAAYVREQVMSSHLQVGGDETLGRGIFELTWI